MKRLEISICLGSSCFARGNQRIVHQIKRFIDEHRLNDQVYFKGTHCFGECREGPVIKVGDSFIHNLEESTIIELLRKELKAHDIKL
jgi:NADH:ubiquinone oxidoreductase subunit E